MNPVEEATNAVNDMLKLVKEAPIPQPKEGTVIQRLDALLDIYTDRLIIKNPKYSKIKNKREIPDLIVLYLNKIISEQERK
jgi:hypothetical protein